VRRLAQKLSASNHHPRINCLAAKAVALPVIFCQRDDGSFGIGWPSDAPGLPQASLCFCCRYQGDASPSPQCDALLLGITTGPIRKAKF
jgi:hypothetical protein